MITRLQEAFQHPGFQKYFSNTSWLIAEKIIKIFSSLLVGVLVTRYLGPEKFGLLSYAISYAGMFAAFTNLVGMDQIVVMQILKNPEQKDLLLGTSFFLKLFSSLLAIPIIASSLFAQGSDVYTTYLILIISSGFIFYSFNVIDLRFQSEVKSKYIVYSNCISLLISAIIKIILIYKNASLLAFAIVTVCDIFFNALLYFLFHIRIYGFPHWNFSFPIAKSLLKESWPLLFSSIFMYLYMKLDQVLIFHLASSKEVGLYATAVRLSEAWHFVPIAISMSVFPAIVNSKTLRNEVYLPRVQKLFFLLTWLSILVAATITLLADPIMQFLFGSEFLGSSDILKIHIWIGIFFGFGIVSNQWYLAEGLQKLLFLRTLIGLLLNVILNFLFIPLYGGVGAAIATVISYACASLFFDLINKKTIICFKMKITSFNLKQFYLILKSSQSTVLTQKLKARTEQDKKQNDDFIDDK